MSVAGQKMQQSAAVMGFLIIGLFSLSGCFFHGASQIGEEESEEVERPEKSEELPISAADVQDENFFGEEGEPVGSCPSEMESWYLTYDHHFIVGTPMETLEFWALGSEEVLISPDGTVTGDPLVPLTGLVSIEMSGSGGSCSGSVEASITPYVRGSCKEGVLEVTIYEMWNIKPALVFCDDDELIMEIPYYGDYEHEGVVFTLMNPGSSSVQYPFSGGEGAKTWTLSFSPPLVPLVLPDELQPPSLDKEP
ncbi:MAG: hypothetical protein JXA25_06055 [Anaerolineales bacterium]|nr:hypothetical protein [Anaerolineales bacterium]